MCGAPAGSTWRLERARIASSFCAKYLHLHLGPMCPSCRGAQVVSLGLHRGALGTAASSPSHTVTHHRQPRERPHVSHCHQADWTKPAAMAIPKEGFFKLEQGRYGPIFPKTPANYGFTIIAKIKPGQGAGHPGVRQEDRGHHRRPAGWSRRAQAALPALGAVRHRQGDLLHVSGDLRHRFRQVHRGRRRPLHEVRHQHDLREPGGLPRRLEDQHAGVHRVRARAPASQLPRVRRVPLRERGRDQEGPASSRPRSPTMLDQMQ